MRSLRKTLVALVLVAMSGALLHAQTPAPEAPDASTATAPAGQQARLSVEEMQAQVATYQMQNREAARRVEQLRAIARKEKDVIKLNCVNDKAVQIKATLNIVDEAAASLEVAIMGRDEEARYHEFTKITISSEKARQLRDEADGCVGDELSYVGDTVVEVNRPEIPDDPTLDDPFEGDVEPPAYASPFE
jgi:hypothetical protein